VNTWLFYTFTWHVGASNQCFMSANTSPKLKLLLVLRQSQIWSCARDSRQHKCRPMLKLTKWINVAIPCSPYLPHEALWNFSPRLGWLKGGTFRLCLSYLAFFEINQREYDTMVRPPGSRLGDSWQSKNACKHTYKAFKTIISLKIKLLHISLKITRMRSRRCFKR
jgi:hypothetical protein